MNIFLYLRPEGVYTYNSSQIMTLKTGKETTKQRVYIEGNMLKCDFGHSIYIFFKF